MKKVMLLAAGVFSLLVSGGAKASDAANLALDCGPSERVMVSFDGEGRPTRLFVRSFSLAETFTVLKFDEQTAKIIAQNPEPFPRVLRLDGSLRARSDGKFHFNLSGLPMYFVYELDCLEAR